MATTLTNFIFEAADRAVADNRRSAVSVHGEPSKAPVPARHRSSLASSTHRATEGNHRSAWAMERQSKTRRGSVASRPSTASIPQLRRTADGKRVGMAGVAVSRMKRNVLTSQGDAARSRTALGEYTRLVEEEQQSLDAKAEEVTTDMAGKGYVPVTLEDMMPNPGVIDAAEMQREGGTGSVALPPTIYTAPIVLGLTATPAERGNWRTALVRLGPSWCAVGISMVLQLTYTSYMNDSIVAVASDDLSTTCQERQASDVLVFVSLCTFVSMVLSDMLETYDVHAWLRAMPACETYEHMRLLRFVERHAPPWGKTMIVVPVSGITRVERTAFYFGLLVPKFVVALACLLAGAGAVLRSGDDFSLVLNSVAATFILQIDDAVYMLLIPDASRKMAAAMPPITIKVRDANQRHVAETELEKARDEYLERPLQIVCVVVAVVLVAQLLDRGFWCGNPLAALANAAHVAWAVVARTAASDPSALVSSELNTTLNGSLWNATAAAPPAGPGPVVALASDTTHDVVLALAVIICSYLSWRALAAVQTSREQLLATYLANLRDRDAFELDDARFTAAGASALSEALAATPSVHSLTVASGVPPLHTMQLFELLKLNTTLTELHLASGPAGDDGVRHTLAGGLPANLRALRCGDLDLQTDMTSVCLIGRQLDYADELLIAAAISAFMHQVGGLTLQAAGLSDAGVVAICEAGHYKLHTLDFASNGLGAPAAHCVAAAMGKNLARASLAHNKLTSPFSCKGKVLGDTRRVGAKVRHDGAEYTVIEAETDERFPVLADFSGVHAVADGLRTSPSLTSLDLSGNQICGVDASTEGVHTDEPIRALASVLAVTRSLMSINLSSNPLSTRGARALAAGLAASLTVTEVDLSHNELREEGTAALASLVAESRSLLTLNLSHNQLGLHGARAFAPHLKRARLTTIDLSCNSVFPEGIIAIADSLASCQTVTDLNLADNQLCGVWADQSGQYGIYTDEAIKAIVQFMTRTPSLSRLDLTSNFFSRKDAQMLQAFNERTVAPVQLLLHSPLPSRSFTGNRPMLLDEEQ